MTQNNYFQFLDENIKDVFKNDTNNRIGSYSLYLVYPNVIVESSEPFRHTAIVCVEKEGINIRPDAYPLMKFLKENQEFCQRVVEAAPYMQFLYRSWSEEGMKPDDLILVKLPSKKPKLI